jgi:hypothetical protein
VESSCELGNEPSGSIKCWEYTEWMHNLWTLEWYSQIPRILARQLLREKTALERISFIRGNIKWVMTVHVGYMFRNMANAIVTAFQTNLRTNIAHYCRLISILITLRITYLHTYNAYRYPHIQDWVKFLKNMLFFAGGELLFGRNLVRN